MAFIENISEETNKNTRLLENRNFPSISISAGGCFVYMKKQLKTVETHLGGGGI